MITAEQATEAARALHEEVKRRNEWYGLDNWAFQDVVNFVYAHTPGVEAEPGEYVTWL